VIAFPCDKDVPAAAELPHFHFMLPLKVTLVKTPMQRRLSSREISKRHRRDIFLDRVIRQHGGWPRLEQFVEKDLFPVSSVVKLEKKERQPAGTAKPLTAKKLD
jgi:hypothetical protein